MIRRPCTCARRCAAKLTPSTPARSTGATYEGGESFTGWSSVSSIGGQATSVSSIIQILTHPKSRGRSLSCHHQSSQPEGRSTQRRRLFPWSRSGGQTRSSPAPLSSPLVLPRRTQGGERNDVARGEFRVSSRRSLPRVVPPLPRPRASAAIRVSLSIAPKRGTPRTGLDRSCMK